MSKNVICSKTVVKLQDIPNSKISLVQNVIDAGAKQLHLQELLHK